MFIANKEKNFEKFLNNNFGIILPKGVLLTYQEGVRLTTFEVKNSQIFGEKGYAACDAGFNPTNAMIQNFGYLANKNILEIDDKRTAEGYAFGKGIKKDLGQKSRYVIIRYKKFDLGLGYYDATEKKIKNKIPEKRRRNIVNSL